MQKQKKERKKDINHKKLGGFLLSLERVLSYISTITHMKHLKYVSTSTTPQTTIKI